MVAAVDGGGSSNGLYLVPIYGVDLTLFCWLINGKYQCAVDLISAFWCFRALHPHTPYIQECELFSYRMQNFQGYAFDEHN